MCVALPGGNVTLIFIFTETLLDNSGIGLSCFEILNFSLNGVARLQEHKQQTIINMSFQFPLFVSSKPHCEGEY